MRRQGFTLWQALGLLALVVIAALILLPVFARFRENLKKSSCQSNLKNITLGFKQYIQDYNEFYPPVNISDAAITEKNPMGWADSLQPYIKSNQIFWCPERIKQGLRDESTHKPHENEYTDYWFNRRMAGKREEELSSPESTILLGDGNDGTDATNARYSLSTLPSAWRADKSSPAHRHFEGTYYAFVDGHVQWLKPNKVTDKKPGSNVYTFAIK